MLEITLKKKQSVAILNLSGNINIDASNFIEKIGWCLENGYSDVLCDFENVNLIDYAGLSVLAIAYKNVVNHKGRIKFLNVPEHIKKIFHLVALDRVFEIYDDEDFAFSSFKEDRIIAEIKKKKLRRRFKRVFLDIDVQFKAKGEEKFRYGKVLNLSAVGLLIFGSKIYPLGEVLNVKLGLFPKPGSIELNARVVWHVSKDLQQQIYPGMGLAFHKIDSAAQQKILAFVDRHLPTR